MSEPGHKLHCNYVAALLEALNWSRKNGCVESLLDQLGYLDALPQYESVDRVAIGPSPYHRSDGAPPSLHWAAYHYDDGRSWQERQVICGSLDYSHSTNKWSCNT
jgi:hypothetical protein